MSDKMKLVTFHNLYSGNVENQTQLFNSIKQKSTRVIETSNTTFEEFQQLVINYFCFQWHMGELFWPRTDLLKRNHRQVPSQLRDAMVAHGRSNSIDQILGLIVKTTYDAFFR